MKQEKTIHQLETDLQELLSSVMRGPLSPIDKELKEIKADLNKKVGDITTEVNACNVAIYLSKKKIESLTSDVENKSEEIQKTVDPLQQEIQRLGKTHKENIGQLHTEIKAELEEKSNHLRESLFAQIQQYAEHSNRLLTSLLEHAKRTEQVCTDSLEKNRQDLMTQIKPIVTGSMELQTALTQQSKQIDLLQKQIEAQNQFIEAIAQPLQSLRRKLITTVCLTSAGLIGTAVLAVRQFY